MYLFQMNVIEQQTWNSGWKMPVETHLFHPLFPHFILYSPVFCFSFMTTLPGFFASFSFIHLLLTVPHRQWVSCTTLHPCPSHSCINDSCFTPPASFSIFSVDQIRKGCNLISCLHNHRSTHLDLSFLRNAENWILTFSGKYSKYPQLILDSACLLHLCRLFLPLDPPPKYRNACNNSGPVIPFLDKTSKHSWKSAHLPNHSPSSELWQLWENLLFVPPRSNCFGMTA